MDIYQTRRQNLLALIDRATGAATLAERCGSSPQYISQLVNQTKDPKTGRARTMGDKFARRLEAAFDLPGGWMDKQHSGKGSNPAAIGVARDLSHHITSHVLTRFTVEQMMKTVPDELPDLFVAPVGSDVLAPQLSAQAEIVWSRSRLPKAGRFALIQDQYDRLHVRVLQEGKRPNEWIAAPRSSDFVTFSTIADAVVIVAVSQGVLDPQDD